MKCILWTAILCAVLGSGTSADALNGNEWKKLPTDARQGYVGGVIDSWATLRGFIEGAKVSPGGAAIYTDLARCIGNREITYGQMNAIVDKYLADHPDKWDYSMAVLVWSAVYDVCNPNSDPAPSRPRSHRKTPAPSDNP